MFGEQQMDSGEIVANFGLGHNVTHFFDPILFLCHIPVELPKLSGFFQTGSTFHCQTYKFSIGIFQTWKSKEKFQTSFDKFRHIWTSLDQFYKNGNVSYCHLLKDKYNYIIKWLPANPYHNAGSLQPLSLSEKLWQV